MRDTRALISALYSLEVVLREAGVLQPDEKFTVELSESAGLRLESWIKDNPPEELITGDARAHHVWDTNPPKRAITLRGITVQWPLPPLPNAGSFKNDFDELGLLGRQSMFDRRVPRYVENFDDTGDSGC